VTAAELSLQIRPEDDTFVWEVTNTGSTSVRLWEQSNSWGWPMPRLVIDDAHVLSPAPRLWTRNFPSHVELAAGESTRYELRAEDFDPATLKPLRELADQPLWVQGELTCEPSAEADEYDVWTGTLRTEKQELQPPHAWLRPA